MPPELGLVAPQGPAGLDAYIAQVQALPPEQLPPGCAADLLAVARALQALNPSPRITDSLLALYTFDEGSGSTVQDTSGVGAPLNLNIPDPSRVTWGNWARPALHGGSEEGFMTINDRLGSPSPGTIVTFSVGINGNPEGGLFFAQGTWTATFVYEGTRINCLYVFAITPHRHGFGQTDYCAP